MTTRPSQRPTRGTRSAPQGAQDKVQKQRKEAEQLVKVQTALSRAILMDPAIQRSFDEESLLRALQEARVSYAQSKLQLLTGGALYGEGSQVTQGLDEAVARNRRYIEKLIELLGYTEHAELPEEAENPAPGSKIIVPQMRIRDGKAQALVPGSP